LKKFSLNSAGKTIGELHGNCFEIETSFGLVIFIPLYHPAAAIYNRALQQTLLKDFQILKKYV
jgi:DNA polymerase